MSKCSGVMEVNVPVKMEQVEWSICALCTSQDSFNYTKVVNSVIVEETGMSEKNHQSLAS